MYGKVEKSVDIVSCKISDKQIWKKFSDFQRYGKDLNFISQVIGKACL